jgi:hypothetical protein
VNSSGLAVTGKIYNSGLDISYNDLIGRIGNGNINEGNLVHISGTETITGSKTFTAATILSGITTFTGNIVANSLIISPTELSYVDGTTSNIQSQLNDRALDSTVLHKTGNHNETADGIKTFSNTAVFTSGLTATNPSEITYKNQTLDERLVGVANAQTISGAKKFTQDILIEGTSETTRYLRLGEGGSSLGGFIKYEGVFNNIEIGTLNTVSGVGTEYTYLKGNRLGQNLQLLTNNNTKYEQTNTITDITNTTVNINSSSIRLSGNGGSLKLVGIDHTYIEYYPDGLSAGRKGYIGYSHAAGVNIDIHNSDGGITLTPKTDTIIKLNGDTNVVGSANISGALTGETITNINTAVALNTAKVGVRPSADNKNRVSLNANNIDIAGTTNIGAFIRMRRGGGTPAGLSGLIFSDVDTSNFHVYNAGALQFVRTTDLTQQSGQSNGSVYGVNQQTLMTLDNNANLTVNGAVYAESYNVAGNNLKLCTYTFTGVRLMTTSASTLLNMFYAEGTNWNASSFANFSKTALNIVPYAYEVSADSGSFVGSGSGITGVTLTIQAISLPATGTSPITVRGNALVVLPLTSGTFTNVSGFLSYISQINAGLQIGVRFSFTTIPLGHTFTSNNKGLTIRILYYQV